MNADILALLLKVSVILVAAALAAFVLRRSSAAWRHFVWSAAMTSAIVLVALQLIVPPIVVRVGEQSLLRVFALPASSDAASSFASPVLNAAEISQAAAQMITPPRETTPAVDVAPTTAARSATSLSANRKLQSQRSVNSAIAAPKAIENSSATVVEPIRARAAESSNASEEFARTTKASGSWSAFDFTREQLRTFLIDVWALGSLLLLLRILRAHWQLRRLVNSSQVINDVALHHEVKNISARLSLNSPVALLVHDGVNTPCTAGWRNPMIMLPDNFAEWCDARRRAVFTHELAHIARSDSLAQTMASMACALFWFHPGFWVAARMLRSESERAADDVVIGAGMSAVEYADHLLALANRSASINRVPLAAVGMARRTQLETRLRAMLNVRQSRRIMTRTAQRVMGTAALFAMVPLAGLQARVQDPRQVQPPTTTKKPPVVVPKKTAPPTIAPPTVAAPTVVPPTKGPPTVAPPTGVAPPTVALPTGVAPPTVAPPTGVAPPTVASPTGAAPPMVVPSPGVGPPTVAPRKILRSGVLSKSGNTWYLRPVKTPPTVSGTASTGAQKSPPAEEVVQVAVSRTGNTWNVLPFKEIAPLPAIPPQARIDSIIEIELRANPDQELNVSLMSGGNVTVHGWDQPTARLRTRITGKYWRETKVLFTRTAKGVELITMAEVNGAQLIASTDTNSWPVSGSRIRVRGQGSRAGGPTEPQLPPVTLENEFELWVPRKTNIRFSSSGGDLTLHELQGTFTGSTKIGNIKANNSSGSASLLTSNGNLAVTSSSLDGGMTTECGTVSLSQVTGGLNAKSSFDPSSMPGIDDPQGRLIIVDGMLASDYCFLKARGGGSMGPGQANEQYPYGDIVRDSVPLGGSLSTRSGSIKIGSASGVLTATAGKGNVEIARLTGDATLIGTNVSARIVNLTNATHYINVRAHGGNVTLELPDSLDAVVDVESGYTAAFAERTKRNPTISSDLQLTRSEITKGAPNDPSLPRTLVHGTTTLGNGNGRILIRVVDGDVILKRTK